MYEEIVARRSFQDGDVVVSEGDASHYAYVVLSGRAKVLCDLDGQQVQVGAIDEGQLFGEASFLGSSRRTATVVADGELELGLIPADLFAKSLAALPDDAQERLSRLSKDLAYLNEVYVRLSRCIDEVEDLREGLLEPETFEGDVAQLPDLARRIATQMRNRLQVSVDACSELFRTLATAGHAQAPDPD
jgi:CRP-like cAMP-binding protein